MEYPSQQALCLDNEDKLLKCKSLELSPPIDLYVSLNNIMVVDYFFLFYTIHKKLFSFNLYIYFKNKDIRSSPCEFKTILH